MKCYLCNLSTDLLFEKSGYQIYRCPSCGLGMTNLQKDYDEFLRQQYAKGYFTGDPTKRAYVSYQKDKPYITKNMEKLLTQVQQIKSTGRLLDVGAAMGYFIELAHDRGYDAYGFDPSLYAVTQAQKLVAKKRIKHGSVHTVDYPPKSFDIITMLDVFEHLQNPKRDLQKLATFLKDDGIILIATGDTKSVFARASGRRWTFYNPPQHLFFFDQSTLTTVLTSTGLKPVHWFRVGKWLSLEYIFHLAHTSGESAFAKWFYHFFSDTSLGRIPLYLSLRDNMVVITKKAP